MSKPISIENAESRFFDNVEKVHKKGHNEYFSSRFKKVQADNPRRWSIVAIAVGALIALGFGSFGGIGLLHSYGVIGTFPPQLQWLSSAIGTIGNTSHFWSLWVLAGGGVAAGAITCVLGIRSLRRVNQVREKENKQILNEQKEYGDYKLLFDTEFANYNTRERELNYSEALFRNKVRIDDKHYKPLWFDPKDYPNDNRGEQRYFVVYRTGDILKASVCMTKDRQQKLIEYLKALDYDKQKL
jgi:hypothetical protein